MPNHRKSDTTHRLQGTWRKDRHGGGRDWPVDESLDPNVIPEFLSWLADDKHAADFWHRTAPVLHGYGLLTQLDLMAFAIMAHLYGEWRELSERLDRDGYIITYQRGLRTVTKPNPVAAMVRKVEKLLFSLMEQFGLSPKARKSLGVVIDADTENELDKFAKYFSTER